MAIAGGKLAPIEFDTQYTEGDNPLLNGANSEVYP